jgi:ribonucleoside-diphosphate reductase subunit M1
MWNVTPTDLWDWTSLKEKIAQHGVRNSLLIAPMPTASTSQILGNNECFEPYTSNIYSRRVLAGEFQVVNPWLLKDLVDMGLWSENMKNRIIAEGGSIARIPNIPEETKTLYKTVWEISQRTIIQMAADRGAFIDQSQSLNIHMKEPTMGKITSMHFAGWKLGLKTGMYYLRTMAASAPIQFTVDQEALQVADTNIARALPKFRKQPGMQQDAIRSSPVTASQTPESAPRPMYATKSTNEANGVPTPVDTPPAASENKGGPTENALASKPFKADVEEGESPKLVAADAATKPDEEVSSKAKQDEDGEDDSKARDGDIYADAVLACSIENPESCVMCSG